MSRRVAVIITALAAAVLCLGSYTFALANAPRPASVSTTQGLGACSTASGYLRLVDSSARCPSGYTSVSLAQATTTSRSAVIHLGDVVQTQTKFIALPGHTTIGLHCEAPSAGSLRLTIEHTGGSMQAVGPINVDTSNATLDIKDSDGTAALSNGHEISSTEGNTSVFADVEPNTDAKFDLEWTISVAGYHYQLNAEGTEQKYGCSASAFVEISG